MLMLLAVGSPCGVWAEEASQPNDVPSLLKDLGSSDSSIASQAAKRLSLKGTDSKHVISALAEAIKHPNEVVRLTVIEALSELGPDAGPAVPALSDALQDKDPMIREAAA